jgi:hypothetical protein
MALTLLLYFAISLYIPFVCASSLHSGFNETTISILDVSDSSSNNSPRTLWDIIWSCAATLFACTWTAIHPNIPGMDEGKVATTSRRLFIMVMALIAPELIITWAVRQFFSARKAAKDFNDAFGAQIAQDNIGEESTATLLTEIPRSHERNSTGALQATGPGSELTGWRRARTFRELAANFRSMGIQDGQ